MEIRVRNLFLGLFGLCTSLTGMALNSAYAQDTTEPSALIQPEVERREFDEAQVDAHDFEIILAAGYLSIEDFGVNALQVVKLNYHVNESISVQAALGQSEGRETSYEALSGGAPLLTDDERELSYYSINLLYNLLPGEAFWNEQVVNNTAFYVTLGIGNTEFAGDDRYTINYGAGYRFLFNDHVAGYADFRNNQFDMDVFGEDKATSNLEYTFGVSWIF